MTNKQAAIKIIKRLHRNGFQALLAGGCVRDMLLGRPAKDSDVATDAQPRDVMELFPRTLQVGAAAGLRSPDCVSRCCWGWWRADGCCGGL